MLTSFILIFMAEMADKTQLLVLAFSRRYSLRSVIAGMTPAVAALCLGRQLAERLHPDRRDTAGGRRLVPAVRLQRPEAQTGSDQ